MINYEVDPQILQPFVPAGTQLDLWQGKALVSLVGFMFLNTRIWRVPIPYHINFEEVNLRFYLKRSLLSEERRGVSFIKEIVPKPAIAYLARWLYGENYVAMPMGHTIEQRHNELEVEYRWQLQGTWQKICMRAVGAPALPLPGSEAEFITEHYWGYVSKRCGKCVEYEVVHPQWRLWDATEVKVDVDCLALYGTPFGSLLDNPPRSAFLAEGSAIAVSKGNLIPKILARKGLSDDHKNY
jgi:uncharacterized protein YqjF (DUF2071 family)